MFFWHRSLGRLALYFVLALIGPFMREDQKEHHPACRNEGRRTVSMATRGAPSHNPPGRWGWSSHIGPLICSCALIRTKHAPRPPFSGSVLGGTHPSPESSLVWTVVDAIVKSRIFCPPAKNTKQQLDSEILKKNAPHTPQIRKYTIFARDYREGPPQLEQNKSRNAEKPASEALILLTPPSTPTTEPPAHVPHSFAVECSKKQQLASGLA
ncbi:hypothetical protein HNY73_000687 [Argiope bruennichi]|uniref:Secreted protein n=1 Tax=Argiope bruennichi TaxID=94029 RepID=A0A8T0G372_ARGBR|nr:hypothetical protein HNY73_000687 [Argiope bruennichi]